MTISSYLQYYSHYRPQDLIFFAKERVFISVLLYTSFLFRRSSYILYIYCTWSFYMAWKSRNKTFKTEGESSDISFHLWAALLNIPIHMSLTSSKWSSLPLPSHLPFPLSPSIRQIWRSLWSMCSKGTLKRCQGSSKKAWTQTFMIQTLEVRRSVQRNIPYKSGSCYYLYFVNFDSSFLLCCLTKSPCPDDLK